jgi:hypothetical protein
MYVIALAFCLHSAVTAPVALALVSLYSLGHFRPSAAQWTKAALLFAAGLSVHLYVPLRADLAPYVWGAPQDAGGFLAYFTASDSHRTIASEAGGTLARLGELWGVVTASASPVLVIVGAAGVVWSSLRDGGRGSSPLWLATGGLAVAATVVSHVIPDNADMHAYLVPVLWALWWGWSQLDSILWPVRNGARLRRAVATSAVLLAASAVCVHAVSGYRAVRHVRLAMSDAWGRRLLESARPGDLIVVHDANTDFLLRGLLQTGTVPSVTVLNAALAESAWYRTWWAGRHLSEATGEAANWTRHVASAWRSRGHRVQVDYGTPGFAPGEMAPLGMLCLWDTTGALAEPEVPLLRVPGAAGDPEFVRCAVWFYYRLALHHLTLGHTEAALRACEEGLAWSPEEAALLSARSELVQRKLAGAAVRDSGSIP